MVKKHFWAVVRFGLKMYVIDRVEKKKSKVLGAVAGIGFMFISYVCLMYGVLPSNHNAVSMPYSMRFWQHEHSRQCFSIQFNA